jgi:hypothetical protein
VKRRYYKFRYQLERFLFWVKYKLGLSRPGEIFMWPVDAFLCKLRGVHGRASGTEDSAS